MSPAYGLGLVAQVVGLPLEAGCFAFQIVRNILELFDVQARLLPRSLASL
jgi:hypothetical protein